MNKVSRLLAITLTVGVGGCAQHLTRDINRAWDTPALRGETQESVAQVNWDNQQLADENARDEQTPDGKVVARAQALETARDAPYMGAAVRLNDCVIEEAPPENRMVYPPRPGDEHRCAPLYRAFVATCTAYDPSLAGDSVPPTEQRCVGEADDYVERALMSFGR